MECDSVHHVSDKSPTKDGNTWASSRSEARGGRALLADPARGPGRSQRRPRPLAHHLTAIGHPSRRPPAPGEPRWQVELFRSRDKRPVVWVARHDRGEDGAARGAAGRLDLVATVPDGALDVAGRTGGQRAARWVPLALAAEGPVHAANRAAGLAGVAVGARITDMRALCPGLKVEYADCGGDRMALERLALWARRWCPWTAADDWAADGAPTGHGLILDTTGSDDLRGGVAAMLANMETRLSLLALSARMAIAPACGAAWAPARFGPVRRSATIRPI